MLSRGRKAILALTNQMHKANKGQNKIILKDKNGNVVANFDTILKYAEEVKYPSGTDQFLRISIIKSTGVKKDVTVSLKELNKIDWSAVDIQCVVNDQNRHARSFIAYHIAQQLNDVPIHYKIGLEQLGISKINNIAVFAAGDHLIVPSNNQNLAENITIRPSGSRLDIDKNYSIKEASVEMKVLMELSQEIGRIVVAHAISAIIRSAFKESGFTPSTILYIVGESGMFKTQYVTNLVQLYDRNKEIKPNTRLNSSLSYVEDTLSRFGENTAVIDDLHTGESSSVKKNNERNLEELIRRVSDNTGRGHMCGNKSVQNNFRGNVIVIGEYISGKGSTLPRALVAKITQRPDGIKLDQYQRSKKLVVSTFYYYFIQWYVDNYAYICTLIDDQLTKHRYRKYSDTIHARLIDTAFYLIASYNILLCFFKEHGVMSDDEITTERNSFSAQVNRLIYEQQKLYGPYNTDFLAIIRNAYQSGKFLIAKSDKLFDESRYDCVIHYNCLCIYSKRFDKVMSDLIPNYDHRRLIRALKENNALKLHESDGKNDIKINSLKKRFLLFILIC